MPPLVYIFPYFFISLDSGCVIYSTKRDFKIIETILIQQNKKQKPSLMHTDIHTESSGLKVCFNMFAMQENHKNKIKMSLRFQREIHFFACLGYQFTSWLAVGRNVKETRYIMVLPYMYHHHHHHHLPSDVRLIGNKYITLNQTGGIAFGGH